jgi:hypothetical protein
MLVKIDAVAADQEFCKSAIMTEVETELIMTKMEQFKENTN